MPRSPFALSAAPADTTTGRGFPAAVWGDAFHLVITINEGECSNRPESGDNDSAISRFLQLEVRMLRKDRILLMNGPPQGGVGDLIHLLGP
jgi:hypothetical protein